MIADLKCTIEVGIHDDGAEIGDHVSVAELDAVARRLHQDCVVGNSGAAGSASNLGGSLCALKNFKRLTFIADTFPL